MDFEVPEHLENRIHKYLESHPGETPENVLERALDQLEASETRLTSEELIASFRKYRGMIDGWTFEEMMSDRRMGLR